MPTGFGALLDADNGNASISWDAPPANGSPITAYRLSWSEGSEVYSGDQTWVIQNIGTNGPYELRLRAENAAGLGPAAVTTTLGEDNNIGNDNSGDIGENNNSGNNNGNGNGNTINIGQGLLPPGIIRGDGPRAVGRSSLRRDVAGRGRTRSKELR